MNLMNFDDFGATKSCYFIRVLNANSNMQTLKTLIIVDVGRCSISLFYLSSQIQWFTLHELIPKSLSFFIGKIIRGNSPLHNGLCTQKNLFCRSIITLKQASVKQIFKLFPLYIYDVMFVTAVQIFIYCIECFALEPFTNNLKIYFQCKQFSQRLPSCEK